MENYKIMRLSLTIVILFVGYKVFDKPHTNFIHADEINAISNHHGSLENLSLIQHPKADYNLLGYSPDVTTFKPRTSIRLWAGREWPEWKIMYKLFKRFGVVNTRLLREDAQQAARREKAEPSSSESDITGPSRKWRRKKKSSTPGVVMVGQTTGPVQRRLVLSSEESNHDVEEVTLVDLPVVQPIITRNPSTFMGVPEDWELEDLAYPGFRAALDSGFHFDPYLPIDQNKKRVQEWKECR